MSPPLLIERFPHSTHVRLLGPGGASDTAIWIAASQQRRDGVPGAPAALA